MPTLKVTYKKDYVKNSGQVNIKIRVCQKDEATYISTPWDIDPKYIKEDGTINKAFPLHNKYNSNLSALMIQYYSIIADIGPSVDNLDLKTLVKKLKGTDVNGASFTKYVLKRTEELRSEKRFSYADTYDATLTHLKAFTLTDDIKFKSITLDFITRFERYLKLRDKKINTIRIYLNNIRAIFNHAIDNDIIKPELFPFRKFKIRQEEPEKRSLDLNEVRKLMFGPHFPSQQRAVDLFMFSLYTAGMNFKDMVYLQSKDIKEGRVVYDRSKTEVRLSVKLHPYAEVIINKYKGKKYLFYLLDSGDKYGDYKNALRNQNDLLEKASINSGISPVTTYHARKTFATWCMQLELGWDVVRQALGHDMKRVTDKYISYDKLYAQVDNAIDKVIGYLESK